MNDIFRQFRRLIYPPKWDSWQTLVWISVFSWAVSLLTEDEVQTIISSIGWLFLIPGIHWALHEESLSLGDKININIKRGLTLGDPKDGFFLGPWITGALVCTFLQSLINGPPWAIVVAWPPISAAIASIPSFIQIGPVLKIPKPSVRQDLIILFLSNLVLSCWLQLYVTTQSFLQDYPSLVTDELGQSAFVARFLPNQRRSVSRGVVLLEQMETELQSDLSTRSWTDVERYLLNFPQQIQSIRTRVFGRSPELPENPLWDLDGRVLPNSEYAVQLFAIWQGPTIDGRGYYLTRTCQITRLPGTRSTSRPATGVQRLQELLPNRSQVSSSESIRQEARINCGSIGGPTTGQPNELRR